VATQVSPREFSGPIWTGATDAKHYKQAKKKEAAQSLCLTLPAVVAEDLYSLVHSVGMQALQQLLEMALRWTCATAMDAARRSAASKDTKE